MVETALGRPRGVDYIYGGGCDKVQSNNEPGSSVGRADRGTAPSQCGGARGVISTRDGRLVTDGLKNKCLTLCQYVLRLVDFGNLMLLDGGFRKQATLSKEMTKITSFLWYTSRCLSVLKAQGNLGT